MHQEEDYLERLTDREREVCAAIAEGFTNREIADLLFVSPDTVKSHVASILGKLEVNSRGEAARMHRRITLNR
ncbi:MAG: helix-turn-helix transcriptional regulator [Thermoflexaceae bacterium]|nr:helix-turn-helix transcriptional regulator [Thermoflexaceae bacterium]